MSSEMRRSCHAKVWGRSMGEKNRVKEGFAQPLLHQGHSWCLPGSPLCDRTILQLLVSYCKALHSLQGMFLLRTFLAPHICPEEHR